MSLIRVFCLLFLIEIEQTLAFVASTTHTTHTFINTSRQASVEDSQPNAKSNEEEVSQLLEKAAQLRREASTLSSTLPPEKDPFPPPVTPPPTILILGANSPLGAKLCRAILRSSNPKHKGTKLVAACHDVSEISSRGYSRLSYEVGAEDGVGSIGAAWSDDKNARFEFDPATMGSYNLQNIRVVECEILDPNQLSAVMVDCDMVVFAAGDFKNNKPRGVSTFSPGLLFRSIVDVSKGRVEVEGVKNVLNAIVGERERRPKNRVGPEFIYISPDLECFDDFPTTSQSFKEIKSLGVEIVLGDKRVKSSVVELAKFDDNFNEEGKDILVHEVEEADQDGKCAKRSINRSDASAFLSDAVFDRSLTGKRTKVCTVDKMSINESRRKFTTTSLLSLGSLMGVGVGVGMGFPDGAEAKEKGADPSLAYKSLKLALVEMQTAKKYKANPAKLREFLLEEAPNMATFEQSSIAILSSGKLASEDKKSIGTIRSYGSAADVMIMFGGLKSELDSENTSLKDVDKFLTLTLDALQETLVFAKKAE